MSSAVCLILVRKVKEGERIRGNGGLEENSQGNRVQQGLKVFLQ